MDCNNEYTVVRVVKNDGTCDQFFQLPHEHIVMLGADNELCFASDERKIIVDLKDVRYVKIKQNKYH